MTTLTLTCSSYESYYIQAQKVRRALKDDFDGLFRSGIDFLVTPTATSVAPEIDRLPDPVQTMIDDVMTVPANLAGIPAISLNLKPDSKELPLGIQVMAPYWSDLQLLQKMESTLR